MSLMQWGIGAVERGLVPDCLTRMAIRGLCGQRLRSILAGGSVEQARRQQQLVSLMHAGPIAPLPQVANAQHYELPAEFFGRVLGPNRKYSCCYWDSPRTTLAQAEDAALAMTCERARLTDGQQILELGCGWGSLTLWMARQFPNSQITAISNSASQRKFIQGQARFAGLTNVQVLTADMNDLAADDRRLADKFDRVVSVEMFEHMRNYAQLLERIARWLRPDGKLFVHLFCHRSSAYAFEAAGPTDWMAQHFFTAGLMPSADLLDQFGRHLQVSERWTWEGTHYRQTAEAWLARLDAERHEVLRIFDRVYGPRDSRRWFQRWRVFFLAVAELFGYDDGRQWQVAHYLLEPVGAKTRAGSAICEQKG